jgi:hypothetical protein
MERSSVQEEIRKLRRMRDRGLGEEGRTKEEQDRAMEGEDADTEIDPEGRDDPSDER